MAREWHTIEDGPVELTFSVDSERPESTPEEDWLREVPGGGVVGEYYVWDKSLSLEDVQGRWGDYGAKVYSDIGMSLQLPTGEYFEAIFPWHEIWPYRRDDRPINPVIEEGLIEHGWLSPVLLIVGRNGCIELGEGNHRIQIAKKRHLQYVPVRFAFYNKAHCVSARERAERARHYGEAERERRRAMAEEAIRFYTDKGNVEPNKGMPKTRQQFNEAHDHVKRQFEDIGPIEFRQDERGGKDHGSGSERQFGFCAPGSPTVIGFAAKTEGLPRPYIIGLMRHEFGHAIDDQYGKKTLEDMLDIKLPDGTERRADAIAEAVWGQPIEYGDKNIQCVGCGGRTERPKHLHQNTAGSSSMHTLSREKAMEIGDELLVDWNAVDVEEFRKGIIVEFEHTDDPYEAADIALDHIAEIPDYYTRLSRMEREAGVDEH